MHTFLYSPLSVQTANDKNNPVLLLLFILKEFVKNPEGFKEDGHPRIGPFEWTAKGSSAQKLREHFSLLPHAFPQLASFTPTFNFNLSTQELITHLEPFIWACKESENLLLFLVRHQKDLALKPILDRICPEGLDAVKEKIARGFRKRGYPFTRWTHSSKTH